MPEPIAVRLLPDRLRELLQRAVRGTRSVVEGHDPGVEEVAGVVLLPLVVVEALDAALELPGDLVGVGRRLRLTRGVRLEDDRAALRLELVDAAGLGHPDLAPLRDAPQHERGARRAAVVRVAVVVDAPHLRIAA